MPLKAFLEQKLKETGRLFEKAGKKEEQDILCEQAYWLTQAIESEHPDDVLARAFSFWERTKGKTGLKPFPIDALPRKTETLSKESAPPAMLTLWGMLDRAFQSGEGLDDHHVSDIFNRLPPAMQTHFIDTVTNHIRTAAKEQTIAPILTDETLLLDLVERTKQTVETKEESVQRLAKKLADWLRYHQTAPNTEHTLEEAMFGMEAEKTLLKKKEDENQKLYKKIGEGGELSRQEDEIIALTLLPHELLIRDRLRMTTAEYIRLCRESVEKLLAAVPPDPKQLALVKQSAVRQELLAVSESEFEKRVRTAAIIRAYSFGKELRRVSIRQFFKSVVEE